MSEFADLAQTLGYEFHDPSLLTLALTHPSFVREENTTQHHNQRLEFLGDAVLQLILTQELYEKFPDVGEGPMTKARAKMVNRRTLAEQGRRLQLGQNLLMSHGEAANGGRDRPSTLADVFEAIIGAIFLDGGFMVARDFVLRQYRQAFGELKEIPSLENPKGELQEILQANSTEAPKYRLAAIAGPDHDRVFECTVHHHGIELGRGQGKSKKSAQTQAALMALQTLRQKTLGDQSSVVAPD